MSKRITEDQRANENSGCSHLDQIKVDPAMTTLDHLHAAGCPDCLKINGKWVHLRLCMVCGHVGCCNSSPNRHAEAHYHETFHPLMRSIEPGETFGYCYPDQIHLDLEVAA